MVSPVSVISGVTCHQEQRGAGGQGEGGPGPDGGEVGVRVEQVPAGGCSRSDSHTHYLLMIQPFVLLSVQMCSLKKESSELAYITDISSERRVLRKRW